MTQGIAWVVSCEDVSWCTVPNLLYSSMWGSQNCRHPRLWTSKLQALCLASWRLPASQQKWPQSYRIAHGQSKFDYQREELGNICIFCSWGGHKQNSKAWESTRIQTNVRVAVVESGRVSWVNPGNAGSAAIFRSMKIGNTCQAGTAQQAKITVLMMSPCTSGSIWGCLKIWRPWLRVLSILKTKPTPNRWMKILKSEATQTC